MMRALYSDRRGAAALEFAMIMPVFALLLIAGAMLGQAYYTIGSVQWAVERTARDLMVDGSLTEAEFEARLRSLTSDMTQMSYQVTYTDTIYGEITVTEVETLLTYTMNLPVVGAVPISYPVNVQSPRPVS